MLHFSHRSQTFRACATQELQQQRFRLVVLMVGGEHKVGIHTGKQFTPFRTGRRFKPGRVEAIEANAVNADRNPFCATQLLAKLCPRIGVRREAMMHVRAGEGERVRALVFEQDVQQHDRIDTAG